MSLHRLAYISTASPKMELEEVDSIVDRANARNRAVDITGALGFNGVNFVQILEGSKTDLDSLFADIKQDSRHSGIIVLTDKEIEKRCYGGFGLCRIQGLEFEAFLGDASESSPSRTA